MTRKKDELLVAERCLVANTLWTRMKGLMGAESLAQGEAMLIEPCNSIHTFFMKFDIDAVYLDRMHQVLAIHRKLKPWRMAWPVFGAKSVLELPGGAAEALEKGDVLCLS